jgi:hypothetical protein
LDVGVTGDLLVVALRRFSGAATEAFFVFLVDPDEESVCRFRDLLPLLPLSLLEPLSKEREEEVCGSEGSVPSGFGASGFGAMGRYLDIIC